MPGQSMDLTTNLHGRDVSLSKTTRQAERELRRLEKQQIATEQAMEQLGRGFAVAGAAILGGLGLAAKAAIDWESAWAGVVKTVDGSPEQMAALEEELRDLATVLPATHQEIASVAEAAGQLGIERESIADFTRTMVDLGETTNLTADQAATAMARIANIMQTPQAEIDRLGAALVALGNDGASTEAEIVEMALRIAGAGQQIGLTESQVLAFANALSSVGINAEAGGSSISRVMINIASSVQAGGDELKLFAAVAGQSTDEFKAAFEEDAANAIVTFIEGLGRMQASGQDVFGVLDTLGLSEIRVRDALLRAAGAGDLFRTSLETGSRAWEENAALTEEANKRYQTTAARLEIARNQLVDFAIDIGGTFLPVLASAAEQVGNIVELFQALPGPVKTAAAALAAAAGAFSLLAGGLLIVGPRIAAFQRSVGDLPGRIQPFARGIGRTASILTGPWGLALGAGITVLGIFANSHAKAQAQVKELTEAIIADSGALGENTRAKIANRLETDGILEAAQRFGIDAETMTDALLGNAEALDTVRDALAPTTEDMNALGSETQKGTLLASENGQAWSKVSGALEVIPGQLGEARESAERVGQAMGDQTEATDTVKGATEEYGAAVDATRQELEDQRTEAEKLKEALDALNEANREGIRAQIGWEEAIDAVDKALKDNGRTLDITTEKGRTNMEALLALADAANTDAQARVNQTNKINDGIAILEDHRTKLIAEAIQFGMTREEAKAFADQVLRIPKKAETEISTPGAKPSMQNLDDVKAAAQAIARTWTATVRANTNPAITAIRGLIGQFRNMTINLFPFLGGAHGGLITGPGGPTDDRIPALLSNGEFVIRAAAVDHFGPEFFAALNAMRLPQFQAGGLVRPDASTRTGIAAGIHVDQVVVKAFSDRFSLRQVQEDLAMRGVS